jgi:hypothetical protein
MMVLGWRQAILLLLLLTSEPLLLSEEKFPSLVTELVGSTLSLSSTALSLSVTSLLDRVERSRRVSIDRAIW